jgi:hypothetical protein
MQISNQDTKIQVLRLKKLLDDLRAVIYRHLPETSTVDQAAKFFGNDWVVTRRFWKDGAAGGPSFIKSVRAKIGQGDLCDEIIRLLKSVPDRYRSLVPFSVEAIELVFKIQDAFATVRAQKGVPKAKRMSTEQFAVFFGPNRKFVRALLLGKRDRMHNYDVIMDREISSVLENTDWNSVRPRKSAAENSLAARRAQLQRLVTTLSGRYPSHRALCQALGIHPDSLGHALGGTARPKVFDRLLKQAQKLAGAAPSEAKDPAVGSQAEMSTQESHTAIGAFLSHMASLTRLGEAMGIKPDSFTDGHRDLLIRNIGKLMVLAKIDEAAITRLLRREGLSASDPALRSLVSAFSGAKKR